MRYLDNIYAPLLVFGAWLVFAAPHLLSATSTLKNVAAIAVLVIFPVWYFTRYALPLRKLRRKLFGGQ